jgi:hypothetical protein
MPRDTTWTAEDTLQLRRLRAAGASINECCVALGRCTVIIGPRARGMPCGPRDDAAIAALSDPRIERRRRAAAARADQRALALSWRLAMLRLAMRRGASDEVAV